MLQLKNISKRYKTGELVQQALDDVTLSLRDNEFVSILGPSGSGKTTMLNIIGGLDRYDSGNLIINGRSTEKYKERDWDTYRNHTIGFVFQSYNLIPHQTIQANVELALTLNNVSSKQRKERAQEVLAKVGLADQMKKKPNQLSGGQMQRVAIARALVNDPDILLADEPTGALDSDTSIQIMELLKEVAKDRLVVMVTHNGELAEEYSTRIVRLKDGKIIGDTNPFDPGNNELSVTAKTEKVGMGFLTSLSLSFQNLMTKKGRTVLTALACSIGIIGIALILSLSTGVNSYIDQLQKDTMVSYPITIGERAVDINAMASLRNQMMSASDGDDGSFEIGDQVYASYTSLESGSAIANNVTENDLTAFKQYLDNPESEIHAYTGENGIVYAYDVNFDVYSYDVDGNLVNADTDTDDITGTEQAVGLGAMMSQMRGNADFSSMSSAGGLGMLTNISSMMSGSSSQGSSNFEELMAQQNGDGISRVVLDNYDMLYGKWPEDYNEAILVLSDENAVSAAVLYQLGLITSDELEDIQNKIDSGEDVETLAWDFPEILEHDFYLIPACDFYVQGENGTFSLISDDSLEMPSLIDDAIELHISGIIRPMENADNASISAPVAYTAALTDYIIRHTADSDVVIAQEANPEINVLTGVAFDAKADEEKAALASQYLHDLDETQQATFYNMIHYLEMQQAETEAEIDESQTSVGMQRGMGGEMSGSAGQMSMSDMLLAWLDNDPDQDILLSIYSDYVGGSSFEDNLAAFGKVSYDAPSSINIYADSFDDKNAITDCIERYNESVSEDEQIGYTDYVAVLTSSISTIINVISYVLIAFVAVSLIVSCIMIGIVTYISVIERTKEIGILRSLGASRRNISQVFNAETFITGLFAGALGVLIASLLSVPANGILGRIFGEGAVSVRLPLQYALLLIVISIIVTVIGGLWPARKAAKKNPVAALRTE